MQTKRDEIIDEAIRLELQVAELYTVFCRAFPQDFDFWWKLVEEEQNHAALLSSLKDVSKTIDGSFPDMLPNNMEALQAANRKVKNLIGSFQKDADRKRAFTVAIEIEQSAGELHYQKFMECKDVPGDFDIFQQLNNDDKDHAQRIRKYMEENNI